MDSPGSRWYLIAGLLICLLLASGCTTSQGAPPLLNTTPTAPAAGTAIYCAEGQTVCSGICRNTAVDAGNCGMCGKACRGGENCDAGICTISQVYVPTTIVTILGAGSGISCAEGQTVCSGICRSTSADSSNCGSCGKVCGSGQYCSAGMCVGTSATVPVTTSAPKASTPVTTTGTLVLVTGLAPVTAMTTTSSGTCSGYDMASCSGKCITVKMDKNNCGSCGNVCPDTAPAGSGWSSMPGCCNGVCTSLYDFDNCGSCGNECSSGGSCSLNPDGISAQCRCVGDMVSCSKVCVDPKTDAKNCGACGNACGTSSYCSAGKCCTIDMANCGGICVDLGMDPNNCGSCGNVCKSGQYCDESSRKCTYTAMTTSAVAPHIPF